MQQETRSRLIEEVAELLLRYLKDRPDAEDTLEGIATWWILQQRLNESLLTVEEALQRLKSQGLVSDQRGPGGRVVYSAQKKYELEPGSGERPSPGGEGPREPPTAAE